MSCWCGDITKKTLGTAQNTTSYTYGDSSWKDLLMSYGGTSITYDNIGNPKTIGDKTLTWKGRELISYTDDSKGFIIGIVGLFLKSNPYLSVAMEILGAHSAITTFVDKMSLWQYEDAMKKGDGILIVTYIFDYDDPRTVPVESTHYYSWDGKSRYLK